MTTGINAGWQDSEVFRGDIVWTPTDNLRFRLIHQEDDQVGQQARVQSRIDYNVANVQGFQMGIARATDIASGGKFNPMYAQAGYPGGMLGRYESRLASTVPNEQFLEQTTFHADWDISDTMHLKYMYGKTVMTLVFTMTGVVLNTTSLLTTMSPSLISRAMSFS